MKTKLLLLLLSLFVSLSFARAAETPESAASTMLEALKQGDLTQFAGKMHPDALASFQKMMLPIAEAAGEDPKGQQFTQVFMGGKGVAELRKSTPNEFFQIFMGGLMKNVPQMAAMMRGSKAQVLGHVMEGPDVAHVVARMQMGTDTLSITKMSVTSLRKDGEQWKGLLSGEIEGMAATLKQQFGK
jgi:ABC-type transporter MlaC component